MMNIIVGLIFVALGTCCALWPRALWWLRWGWLLDREPTRMELLFDRMGGMIIAVLGLAMALLDYL